MRRRAFLKHVTASGAGLSVGMSGHALAALTPSSSLAFPPLQSFEIDTVIVDRAGRTIGAERHRARFFTERVDDTVTLDMVAIPAGRHFSDATSVRSQALTFRPFYLGRTLVTQAQWRAVSHMPRQRRDLDASPSCFVGDEHPVECISWHEAEEFCARLAAHTGRAYRLPTETEWEGACRAGTNHPFHYGATVTADLANYGAGRAYAAEPTGTGRRSTTPVAQFMPNRHGLYDMHGNVWEWCADDWQPRRNGTAASHRPSRVGENWRVLRGGSWADAPARLRADSRSGNRADAFNRVIGLRIALSLESA